MTCDQEKLNNLVGCVSFMVRFFGMRMGMCIGDNQGSSS